MADPILVVAWLVLAHVAADFVLQTGSIAHAKSSHGLRAVGGLIEAGTITPVIDRTYPLIEAPDAIRYLEEGHPGGKVVITV